MSWEQEQGSGSVGYQGSATAAVEPQARLRSAAWDKMVSAFVLLIWSVYVEGKTMCVYVWKCPSHVSEYIIEQFLPLSTNAFENGVNVLQ